MGKNYILPSTNGTHYTDAIAANGGVETETFPALAADGRGHMTAITIKSADKRSWQIEYNNPDGDITVLKAFDEDDGVAAAGNWYYTADIKHPIPNFDGPLQTTVGVRNNSAAAKIASSTFVLTIIIEK